MRQRLNSGEKCAIRTMALFINENTHNFQTLKVINTGSYKYTITLEYIPNMGLKFNVIKNFVNGKLMGNIEVTNVSEYGVEYVKTFSLGNVPDSVTKYIKTYYKYLNNYLQIGEKAFN